MHHVVYLPHARTTDPQQLVAVGLGDQIEGAELTEIPGDQPVTGDHCGGVLVSWGGQRPKLSQLKSALTWLPALPLDELEAGRYFVGLDPARPPKPHDLLKARPYAGEPVLLGDGELWMVPHAAQLPHDIVRDQTTGEIQQVIRPAFYAFWTKCAQWQRMFEQHTPGEPLPTLIEQVEFLEEALRINFRLTPEIISERRLFQTGPEGTLRACLRACLRVHAGGEA